ncbi:hypothetical protein [Nitrosopumilus sp.]
MAHIRMELNKNRIRRHPKNSSEDTDSAADTLYDVFKVAKKNFDDN